MGIGATTFHCGQRALERGAMGAGHTTLAGSNEGSLHLADGIGVTQAQRRATHNRRGGVDGGLARPRQ